MKTKILITIITFLFSATHVEAQLLEKLKERAKEKGMETREVSYDSTENIQNKTYTEGEDIKISSAKDFFTKDVVMALYNDNNQLVQTAYFDKETIAMRTETVANPKYPIYHDRSGKIYAFDDDEEQYKTMSLLPASSMGFMTAGMTTQAYKLPQTPYFNALKALSELDIAMNFLILEMAFIYEPKHFEKNDFYKKSEVSCGGNTCTRFSYNDTEYAGSYIQFDLQKRLRELNIISTNSQFTDDSKNNSGKFVFSYKPVTVKLPDAVEQSLVPGPLGEIIPLEKGLEPWKYNKKDKNNNKN